MNRFSSLWHEAIFRDRNDAASSPRNEIVFSTASLVRILIAAFVGFYFLCSALASDDPTAMLVGTFPIAWIAVELAWVALRFRDE